LTTGEWILIGVGVAQAIALAVAAYFAWRAFEAAKLEREATAKERRADEGRKLLQGVIDETKALAILAEERVPGVGMQRLDLIMGQQHRLSIALSFFPESMLPQTRALASGTTQDVNKTSLDAAAAELAQAAHRLVPASFQT
jgi:hypothetical protein